MTWLILLVVFVIWYFTQWLNYIPTHAWTRTYIQSFSSWLEKRQCPALWILVILTSVPVILFLILYTSVFSWLAALLNLLILAACLQNVTVDDDPSHEKSANHYRAQAEQILWQGQRNVFAVIFWFCVLGGFGALLYRLLDEVDQNAHEYEHSSLLQWTKRALAILDWIPVRLLGLLYAIAGDFIQAWHYWLQFATQGLSSNQDLINHTGLAALHVKVLDKSKAHPDEVHKAHRLVHRAILVWVIIVAIIGLVVYI